MKRYFTINSKQFAKILPGFRPKSLTETKVKYLLKQHYKKHFISSFIEKNVKIWLSEIEEAINEAQKRGSTLWITVLDGYMPDEEDMELLSSNGLSMTKMADFEFDRYRCEMFRVD